MRQRGLVRLYWIAVVLPLAAGSTNAQQASADELTTRGMLTPGLETTLSSPIAAIVEAVSVNEGDQVEAGQTLALFDCRIQKGELQKAQAELEAARVQLATNRRLAQMRATSAMSRDLARIDVAKAEAEVVIRTATVSLCEVKAPFAGRIASRTVNPYQTVSLAEPLFELLDDKVLEVRMPVPSTWLRWLRIGQPFVLDVDETGHQYTGHVQVINPRVDPASQSINLIGVLSHRPAELRAGMSGTVRFPGP